MSSTATTNNTSVQPKVLVIELVDRRESNYILDENPEAIGEKGYLDAPTSRKIKSKSKIKWFDQTDQTWKLKEIRYIKGCDIIDVKEQNLAGYVPNTAEDVIWIENGSLQVVRSGNDVGKYEYLKAYHGNENNPLRPDDAPVVFREISTEVDAKVDEDLIDLKYKAETYIQSLKAKDNKGGVTYQEDKLKFLAQLFNLPAFDTGFTSEAWVALAEKAATEPRVFLDSIASSRALYEVDVNQAIAKGVILVDKEQVSFEGGKLIMQLPAHEKKAAQVQLIIDHFANPDNVIEYENLRSKLLIAKQGSLGIIN